MFEKKIKLKMFADYNIINMQLIGQWNCSLHYAVDAPRAELVH